MTIKYLDETYLEASVSLIAKYNKEKCYQIGYCAVPADSIRRDLVESLKDEDNKLIGVLEEGILMGVVDLDIDLNKKAIEIVGPFIERQEEEEWLKIGKELLDFVFKECGSYYKYLFFIHQENKIGKKLLESIEAKFNGYEYTLSVQRDCMQQESVDATKIILIDTNQYEEVVTLHDGIWPDVYYSGQELIDQLDGNHQLFIIKNEEEMEGYVFIENEAERGYIHFLAVKEPYRRTGIGRRQLNKALEWSFENNQIKKVSLCVEAENENALSLYYNVGFEKENAYAAYEVEAKEEIK